MFVKNENYVEHFLTPEMKEKALLGIADQVIKSDIGMSASAIVDRFINKKESTKTAHPWDASDFGRCYRLINAMEINVAIMIGISKEWNSIVAMWEPLCNYYESDKDKFRLLLDRILELCS